MSKIIPISEYNYPLTEDRIAKFPLENRDDSKLLLFQHGEITDHGFRDIANHIPADSVVVFNNTKVIRARLMFFKESGARIEIFCLEPHTPADYERSLAAVGSCRWSCIVGNLKKWKEGALHIGFEYKGVTHTLSATRIESIDKEHIIQFDWSGDIRFGELLELLGRIPIPPYLNRDTQEIDQTRYQTVYSKFEGSVAAPTAGLHFTPAVIESLREQGCRIQEVTLHVGAGTFVPVKAANAAEHVMHAEHFDVTLDTLQELASGRCVVGVGTTSVRTLESLSVLGYRALTCDSVAPERVIGQWEAYNIPTELTGEQLLGTLVSYMKQHNMDRIQATTQIMITPGYRFRVVQAIVTNFHQPQSTLLLLISALIGEDWRKVYTHALENNFRFLSYGDSSLLFLKKQ